MVCCTTEVAEGLGVKHRGVSATGLPVYSTDDATDFLLRWLRLSWPEVLCGRRFDQNGETVSWYLCAVTDVCGFEVIKRRGDTIEGLCTLAVFAHTPAEESSLRPEQSFNVEGLRCTLTISADVRRSGEGFEVRGVSVLPYQPDIEQLIVRYGGRRKAYVWRPA